MGPIIQTLTLAAILLIMGLVFLVIGVAGLMWSIKRDRRQLEKTRKEMTSGELTHSVLPKPAIRERSLKS